MHIPSATMIAIDGEKAVNPVTGKVVDQDQFFCTTSTIDGDTIDPRHLIPRPRVTKGLVPINRVHVVNAKYYALRKKQRSMKDL